MICIMSNFGWLISVAVHFHVVNLHDITMPKGLHFTAVGFFFLFWRLISEVTEQISAKLGHVFTYDCFLKNLVQTSSGIYPLLQKNCFFEPTLNFDQTYLCNRTCYQQSEWNLSVYRYSPICPPNLVNFGPEMAENVWWVFAHPPPLNFCIGKHCQPYRMDVI